MPLPTLVQMVNSAWGASTGSSRTSTSFNVLAGDRLLMVDWDAQDSAALTCSGGSLTWSPRSLLASSSFVPATSRVTLLIMEATVDVDKSMTVTVGSSIQEGGFTVFNFRDSDGIIPYDALTAGYTGGTRFYDYSPQRNNSALVVVVAALASGTTDPREWYTEAGDVVEANVLEGPNNWAYFGVHTDAGSGGGLRRCGIFRPILTASGARIGVIEVFGTPDPDPPVASMTGFGIT